MRNLTRKSGYTSQTAKRFKHGMYYRKDKNNDSKG